MRMAPSLPTFALFLPCLFSSIEVLRKTNRTDSGLSLTAGGRGFSPTTKRVACGYFYWKIEQK